MGQMPCIASHHRGTQHGSISFCCYWSYLCVIIRQRTHLLINCCLYVHARSFYPYLQTRFSQQSCQSDQIYSPYLVLPVQLSALVCSLHDLRLRNCPIKLTNAYRTSASLPVKQLTSLKKHGTAGIRVCGRTRSAMPYQGRAQGCCMGLLGAGWLLMWRLTQPHPSISTRLRHFS